ncbi:MAG: hypothetical protein ACXWIU_10070 [Limisphaerales bacterium]
MVRGAVALGLCLSAVCESIAANAPFADLDVGYSLFLPDGWIPTKGEAAGELAGLKARLEPAVPAREVPVVFLRSDEGTISSSFPKIVVHVQPDSEIGYKQFQSIHAFHGAVERTVARSLRFREERGILQDASYDAERKALSFLFTCQNGHVVGIGYSFLTTQGLVNLYCYAPLDDFDRWKGEFMEIGRSVQIATDLKPVVKEGRPRLIESADDWKFVFFVVVMLILAALKAYGRVPWLEREIRTDEI